MTKEPAHPRTFEDVVAAATPRASQVAYRLRELVREVLPDTEEKVYGGAKALALYNARSSSAVICGLQPSGDGCLLYVHGVREGDSRQLKLEGGGKHALHVRFDSLNDVRPDAVRSLLELARSRA